MWSKAFGWFVAIIFLIFGIDTLMEGAELRQNPVPTLQYGWIASLLLGTFFLFAGLIIIEFLRRGVFNGHPDE